MKRLHAAFTVVVMTLLREWKTATALLIALYVAVALVAFLDRSMIWQCVGRRGC